MRSLLKARRNDMMEWGVMPLLRAQAGQSVPGGWWGCSRRSADVTGGGAPEGAIVAPRVTAWGVCLVVVERVVVVLSLVLVVVLCCGGANAGENCAVWRTAGTAECGGEWRRQCGRLGAKEKPAPATVGASSLSLGACLGCGRGRGPAAAP